MWSILVQQNCPGLQILREHACLEHNPAKIRSLSCFLFTAIKTELKKFLLRSNGLMCTAFLQGRFMLNKVHTFDFFNLRQNIVRHTLQTEKKQFICGLAVLRCSHLSVELYTVWLILCSTHGESVWSSAASNVNSFLGIFPKTCAQAHADKHWPSPSVCKCWHVCWLWFSAGACFSSQHEGRGAGGKALRQSYLALTLISLLPFVSHTSVQGLLLWLCGLSESSFVKITLTSACFLVCKLNMAGFGPHYFSCVAENVPTTIKTLFSWKCTPCLDSSCWALIS